MTTPPPSHLDTTALRAACDAGWDMAESESRVANSEWGQSTKVQEDIIEGRKAYNLLLARIEQLEKVATAAKQVVDGGTENEDGDLDANYDDLDALVDAVTAFEAASAPAHGGENADGGEEG